MIKLSTRIIANKNNHKDPLKTALRFPSQSVSAGVWLLLPSMKKIQVLTIFLFIVRLHDSSNGRELQGNTKRLKKNMERKRI